MRKKGSNDNDIENDHMKRSNRHAFVSLLRFNLLQKKETQTEPSRKKQRRKNHDASNKRKATLDHINRQRLNHHRSVGC